VAPPVPGALMARMQMALVHDFELAR